MDIYIYLLKTKVLLDNLLLVKGIMETSNVVFVNGDDMTINNFVDNLGSNDKITVNALINSVDNRIFRQFLHTFKYYENTSYYLVNNPDIDFYILEKCLGHLLQADTSININILNFVGYPFLYSISYLDLNKRSLLMMYNSFIKNIIILLIFHRCFLLPHLQK